MSIHAHSEAVPGWTRGDRLRKARIYAGLSTNELAERMGVSTKTVNNAEADRHEVRRILLNAWADTTGVPLDWLRYGVEPAGPTKPSGQPVQREEALLEDTERRRRRTTGHDTEDLPALYVALVECETLESIAA